LWRRGNILFHDGAKGNCYDCHGEDGGDIQTFGSTNLTRPDLYLYGAGRDAIRESIIKGRHGSMPPFEGVLKPEELKAVSVYVFSHAAPPRRHDDECCQSTSTKTIVFCVLAR
jgi:cbb3-type cytochrome c oxidase subunit III